MENTRIDMEQLLYDAEQGYALSTEARQALAAEVRRLRVDVARRDKWLADAHAVIRVRVLDEIVAEI